MNCKEVTVRMQERRRYVANEKDLFGRAMREQYYSKKDLALTFKCFGSTVHPVMDLGVQSPLFSLLFPDSPPWLDRTLSDVNLRCAY